MNYYSIYTVGKTRGVPKFITCVADNSAVLQFAESLHHGVCRIESTIEIDGFFRRALLLNTDMLLCCLEEIALADASLLDKPFEAEAYFEKLGNQSRRSLNSARQAIFHIVGVHNPLTTNCYLVLGRV